LFDKAHRQAKQFAEDKVRLKTKREGSQEEFKLEELAELIVTLDPYTTGFMQDLQLVIQLSIDQLGLKLKTGLKSVASFAEWSVASFDLN
jgi:hypothetical protein